MQFESETEWLLFTLWNTKSQKAYKFSVPDTVIFREGKPLAWYFTTKEGMLKRKIDLSYKHITKSFLLSEGEGCKAQSYN